MNNIPMTTSARSSRRYNMIRNTRRKTFPHVRSCVSHLPIFAMMINKTMNGLLSMKSTIRSNTVEQTRIGCTCAFQCHPSPSTIVLFVCFLVWLQRSNNDDKHIQPFVSAYPQVISFPASPCIPPTLRLSGGSTFCLRTRKSGDNFVVTPTNSQHINNQLIILLRYLDFLQT